MPPKLAITSWSGRARLGLAFSATAEALAYRQHGWQFWKPKKPEG